MNRKLFLLIAGLACFAWSCEQLEPQPTYRVGFSQCTMADAWRQAMVAEMELEASFYPEINLSLLDANRNTERQKRHIQQLVEEGVDLLIVSPNEAAPLTEVIASAYQQGIPVIVVDRKINSDQYTAYVGGDNFEIGKMAGEYAAQLLGGKGAIIEIWGLRGSTPALERHRGFIESLGRFPEITVVAEIDGQWERDTAAHYFPEVLQKHPQTDLIFAHNDVMAAGAYEQTPEVPSRERLRFVGVDGLVGGQRLVEQGVLDATFLYPTGGNVAIRLAVDILQGRPYAKNNLLNTTLIDSASVRILRLQADKISQQQADINRQQGLLIELDNVYRSQRVVTIIISLILLITIIFAAIAYLNVREKREANRRLSARNEEIIKQRNHIRRMAEEAETANQSRIDFFTNISHEFRTPLTLLLGPVEDLIQRSRSDRDVSDLVLIRQNALRLLRLVNQLMDFRKIENGKMQLRASKQDIVSFVRNTKEAFNRMANQHHIDFQFFSDEQVSELYFDEHKLDKVLFNLLSNAFKFTESGGRISVKVQHFPVREEVGIRVEDNGRGMSKEHTDHIFERFYQGEGYRTIGTGLGLSLSKELIQLHRGRITVDSEKGRGTAFEVFLPLGNTHLEPSEIEIGEVKSLSSLEVNTYLEDEVAFRVTETATRPSTTVQLLLIEDNSDLRSYLVATFSEHYQVTALESAEAAWDFVLETGADLIICDYMLPGMTGVDFTNAVKHDIRTSHIPILLLTARTEVQDQLVAMEVGADMYVTKPFNMALLKKQVASLLANRSLLKERYVSKLGIITNHNASSGSDQKFIRDFIAVIETNLHQSELKVTDISQALHLSRVQLHRKVKSLLGISVSEYLSQVRLKKSLQLLQEQAKPIAEIAYDVGFSSPAYFATSFKNHFGCTPTEYRKNGTLIQSTD